MHHQDTKLFRPLRAARATEEFANSMLFRDWAYSLKIDGIRVLNVAGTLYTRKMEVVPNRALQQTFGGMRYDGFDGEMLAGDWSGTQSLLSTADMPLTNHTVNWHIFDDTTLPNVPYANRYLSLKKRIIALDVDLYVASPLIARQFTFDGETPDERMRHYVDMGYEGIMVRRWDQPYKFGESTLKKGELIKVKPSVDAEAICTGFVESMQNNNALELNNLGLAKRSSKAANKVPKNTLGTLLGTWTNEDDVAIKVRVSSGITAQEAAEVWNNKERYVGRAFTFSFQEETPDGKPRFPVFKGWRYD